MKKVLIYLYNNLPKSIQHKIGRSLWLKKIRDFFLKSDGRYKESSVKIKKTYINQNVEFVFYASIKTAAEAKKSGIETKICIPFILCNNFWSINTHRNQFIHYDPWN